MNVTDLFAILPLIVLVSWATLLILVDLFIMLHRLDYLPDIEVRYSYGQVCCFNNVLQPIYIIRDQNMHTVG